MKMSILPFVIVGHIVMFVASVIVLRLTGLEYREFALVAAAVAGTFGGAYGYHLRAGDSPMTAKVIIGIVMAVLCVVEGLVAQHFWGYFKFPDVSIPIAGIGTFFFPFFIFGTFLKSFEQRL
jgi:hypothetical protein